MKCAGRTATMCAQAASGAQAASLTPSGRTKRGANLMPFEVPIWDSWPSAEGQDAAASDDDAPCFSLSTTASRRFSAFRGQRLSNEAVISARVCHSIETSGGLLLVQGSTRADVSVQFLFETNIGRSTDRSQGMDRQDPQMSTPPPKSLPTPPAWQTPQALGRSINISSRVLG